MKTDRIFTNSNISKGGLLGAIIGAFSSQKIYRPGDKPVDKVIKTGTTAGLGYILGKFIEKLIQRAR